jgi:hypothetical protein
MLANATGMAADGGNIQPKRITRGDNMSAGQLSTLKTRNRTQNGEESGAP